MGEVVAGAYVEIRAELAEPPFVLGRDLLGDQMLAEGETMTDVTHEVVRWRHRRGSSEPYGPLTRVMSGRADVDLWDPTRRYDPTGGTGGRIRFGAVVELWVDAEPVWTGRLDGVTHSYMPRVSGWIVVDAVRRLQATNLTLDTAGVAIAAGSTFDQAADVLDAAGVDAAERVFYGDPRASRSAIDADTRPVWEWLESVRAAELGDLWVDRYGRVALRGRHVAPDDAIRATIGADGIDCDGLFVRHERRAFVSGVNLAMLDGDRQTFTDAAAEAEHGERRVSGSEDELRLA